MTGKERVLAALNHQVPDAIPIDFGSTATTGVHVSCVAALRDHFGLERRPVKVHEPYQMLGWLDDDLKEALGVDVEGVMSYKTIFGFPNENWKTWETQEGIEVLVSEHFRTTVDANGDTLLYPEGDPTAPPSGRMPKGGHFFDTIIRQDPIDESRLNPDDNLQEFQPITALELDHLAGGVARATATGRAVIATFGGTAFGDIALVTAPFLKRPRGIRDVTEWYISTATRRDFLHTVFARQCEIALANLQRIHARVGNAVDAVFLCGTDFGTQTSAFCSVATFKELYMPYYLQVNQWIHDHTTWKTFKHSCGAIEKFIPSLIDCGFDILNPVQCSAVGMDPHDLKERYGDRVVFWGGGIDTQHVLPFGTPSDVRAQVRERCRIFGPGGGFVFNTVHNIQALTPVENIVAMTETVRQFAP